MISFAYIGREDEGKGLETLIKAFSELETKETKLYVFGPDKISVEKNIHYMGWRSKNEIWVSNFDYVILPMTAPETYCLVLHEAELHGKRVIVNEENPSLVSQITSGAVYYNNNASGMSLTEVIRSILDMDGEPIEKIKLRKMRCIWDRLEKKLS